MKPTELMFFFDTEDFTSNRSADAIADLAGILTGEGITGHFAIVGLLAKQLEQWGRADVISALKPHLIGTHTYGHSLHPDICEQTDFEDFHKAYSTVAGYEDEAIELIKHATGTDKILFACPPGNSKSYTAMYYYADRGIPFYCDTVIHNSNNKPLIYCNAEHVDYLCSFETLFLEKPKQTNAQLLDRLAQNERAIVYTHPNMSVKTKFWDSLNYYKGNLREWGDWIEAPNRPEAETAAFYADIRSFIQAAKADERFVITNLNEILAKREQPPAITRGMLPEIRKKLYESFTPLEEPCLSLSDIFLAAVAFLGGAETYTPGKTYGFLSAPKGVTQTVMVTKTEITEAARAINTNTFLPPEIRIGNAVLGPADFLFAALDALVNPEEHITVRPKTQLNDISQLKDLEEFKLAGTWVHTPELKDDYLSERLRLQCWTLKNA